MTSAVGAPRQPGRPFRCDEAPRAGTGRGDPGPDDPAPSAAPVTDRQAFLPSGRRWHHRAVAPDPWDERTMGRLAELGDAHLLVGLARTVDGALAEVYRRHGRAVYGMARRVLGDGTEAEDVTQEVFVHLWEHPERVDPARGSLRTYLLTRAHSRAVDVVRSRAARARREARDASAAPLTASDLEREVGELALAERMSAAVAALPSDERAAIELAYFDGHTYRKVAEVLDQPEGTVKSRIRRGLGRLREVLEGVELP